MKINKDSILFKLETREQEFVRDVINDMLYDAKGIKIPMKGAKHLRAIAEAMATCIYESKQENSSEEES
jgi:hypothetical protein